MKRNTVHNRRSRRKAKGSNYGTKKRRQYKGIFNPSSPFTLTGGSTGMDLASFKNKGRV